MIQDEIMNKGVANVVLLSAFLRDEIVFCVQIATTAGLAVGDERCGKCLITWRFRCRTHFIHPALSALWAEEIGVHCAVVSVVFVSLLFCGVACCAGVLSNALVKMNTPYGCYPLRSLTSNQKRREIEMRDGKALYLATAKVLLCGRCHMPNNYCFLRPCFYFYFFLRHF